MMDFTDPTPTKHLFRRPHKKVLIVGSIPVLAIVLLSFLWPQKSAAPDLTPTQQHGGIIQGKVIQKTDYGKHTTLDFVNQFGEIVSTIKTDDPQFEEDLPEGTYTLVAIKERATVTTIVSLAADSTTYVEVLFQ